MSDSSKHLDDLSPKKRALFEMLLKEKKNAARMTITPSRNESNAYPLSYAQQRLWFLDQIDPGSPIYNLYEQVRIVGLLNANILRQSLDEILRRHEILRTTFAVIDGQTVQITHSDPLTPLYEIDLCAYSDTERAAELERILNEEAQHGFDLTKLPLMRMTLLQLTAEETILVIVMHHLISDAWSMGIFIRELATLYEAYSLGGPSPLPDMPIQYADFAQWQRRWLQGEIIEKQIAYWKQNLADAPPLLDLPTDRARTPVQSFEGDTQNLMLPRALLDSIAALSRQEGATLFMVLLAAFQTLLFRYTGQTDIVVGSPIANRQWPEVAGSIGFFMNTLVFRTDLSALPSFRDLIQRVRAVTLGAYSHQDLPFEKLVEELNPERNLSYHPVFQVAFVLQNAPMPGWEQAGLHLKPLGRNHKIAKHDLHLLAAEVEQSLLLQLEYNVDLFDGDTIVRMLQNFQTLLEAVVANPDQPITHLSLLSPSLAIAGDDLRGEDQDVSVHRLFEEQVERDPDAIALSYENKRISYLEVNKCSNQIAHALLHLASEQKHPIPILLSSSPHQIYALLGILKAGYPFACLDPQFPEARLKQILDQMEPSWIITDVNCLEQHQAALSYLQQHTACNLLVLDSASDQAEVLDLPDILYYGPETIAACSTANPCVPIRPSDRCYVAYTSGSTGVPKGIIQTHENFCQFVDWFGKQFQLSSQQRIAQWARLTFDPAYVDIFATLCFGATLCMTTESTKMEPAAVMTWLQDEHVTLIQIIPSFFKLMLGAAEGDTEFFELPLPDLRYLLFVGETLPVDLASTLVDQFFDMPQIFNVYGPTEAIAATIHRVENVSLNQRSVSIGRAIPGRQILILDAQLQPCPIGVKGEICIRSPYLALGYLGQLDQTQHAFIQNPFSSAEADRIYRTGDLGRWLADSTIEFCGRIDHQVKIRGIRIELEEVEMALSRHKSVIDCTAVVHDYGADDHRLIAYVVASGALTSQELRKFLKMTLPDYMIPAMVIFMYALPRTHNGKINRALLPKPDLTQLERNERFVAPGTAMELEIADMWRELLKIDRIGIYDNFFDLGGHSLLATQVINRLRQSYTVEIPLRSFLDTPTVAHLARSIELLQAPTQRDRAKVTQLMEEVGQLSDEEVRALLAQEKLRSS